MTIQHFVPEVWSAAILSALRDQLVFGQTGIINRNYEGEIAQAGDTVHITSFGDPATREYEKNGTIEWDLLESSGQTLVVDRSRYFAFKVDDIDRRQALGGFIDEATTGAAYNLSEDADTYLAGQMGDASTSVISSGSGEISAPAQAYQLLVQLRTRLNRTKTPRPGRWVVVPPEFYAQLLLDRRFVSYADSGSTDALRNGAVGRAAGFEVLEANTSPEPEAGVYRIIAGHGIATTYAEQIASTEAMRLQNTFGDGIRGLHLYGAEVLRPDQLAHADVVVPDPVDSGDGGETGGDAGDGGEEGN